jgi:hypothetical protein
MHRLRHILRRGKFLSRKINKVFGESNWEKKSAALLIFPGGFFHGQKRAVSSQPRRVSIPRKRGKIFFWFPWQAIST